MWAALSDTRSRAVPAGTVGGRIAGTQKPRCHSASASASVAALSPITIGWIGVDESAELPRQRPGPLAPVRDQARKMRTPRTLVADQREARPRRLREQGGGRRRVDVRPRGLQQRLDDGRVRRDERAGHSRRLAERPHHDDALRAESEMRECAAPLAQHAEAVRVVDDEPPVEFLRERQQFRQRREVAVHAEDGVGCNQPCRGRARPEPHAQRSDVAMRVADELRPRQERPVVETGVIEAIREHRVAAPGERGQDRQIGEVSGRKRERARVLAGPDERSEFRFERVVRRGMAADEMRGARSDAPARGCVARRSDDDRMVREAEVIVARERDELAAGDDDSCTLRRGKRAPRAREARGGAHGKLALEARDQRGLRHVSSVDVTVAESGENLGGLATGAASVPFDSCLPARRGAMRSASLVH